MNSTPKPDRIINDMNPFVAVFDFSRRRTWPEAIGFFLVSVSLLFLVNLIIGAFWVYVWEGQSSSRTVFKLMGIVVTTYLSFSIVYKKKLRTNFVLVASLSVLASILINDLIGLLITAYLTTVHPHDKATTETNDRKPI